MEKIEQDTPPTWPVEISGDAISHLKKIFNRKAKEGEFIRIGVKGGGCSGFEYVLKFDSKRYPNDLEMIMDNLLFLCDQKSANYLKGSKLVYTGNLMQGGLQFENPNAKRSCGCGTSFTPTITI